MGGLYGALLCALLVAAPAGSAVAQAKRARSPLERGTQNLSSTDPDKVRAGLAQLAKVGSPREEATYDAMVRKEYGGLDPTSAKPPSSAPTSAPPAVPQPKPPAQPKDVLSDSMFGYWDINNPFGASAEIGALSAYAVEQAGLTELIGATEPLANALRLRMRVEKQLKAGFDQTFIREMAFRLRKAVEGNDPETHPWDAFWQLNEVFGAVTALHIEFFSEIADKDYHFETLQMCEKDFTILARKLSA